MRSRSPSFGGDRARGAISAVNRDNSKLKGSIIASRGGTYSYAGSTVARGYMMWLSPEGYCRGSNALRFEQVMINGIGIVGFRDPHGIRPLVFGTREKTKVPGATKDYVVSSESVAMDMLGFDLERKCTVSLFLFCLATTWTLAWRQMSRGLRPCVALDT